MTKPICSDPNCQIRILGTPVDWSNHWVSAEKGFPEKLEKPEPPNTMAVNAVEIIPLRRHKRKKWDVSGSYHRRVQRKWIKRWGTQGVPKIVHLSRSLVEALSRV